MDAVIQRLVLVAGGALSCAFIGLFVYFKDPKNEVNRYFALFNVSAALWNSGDFFATAFRSDLSLALYADRIAYIASPFFILFYVRFYCALCETKPGRFVRILMGVATPVMAVLVLTPAIIKNVNFEQGFAEEAGSLFWLFGTYLCWAVLYGFYKLLRAYRGSSETRRIQIQWVLAAFGMVALAIMSFALWIFVSNELPLYYFFEVAYSMLIAYAIVKHGAMDVKTVIHRTALWGLTSAVVVVPVAFGFWFLLPWMNDHPVVAVGVLASLCLVILVYARRVQPYIDHYFQRRRYDLYQAVQRLTDELVPLKGIAEVSGKVVATVRDVLYAEQAFVVVLDEKGGWAVYPPSAVEEAPFDSDLFSWFASNNEIATRKDCQTNPSLVRIQEGALRYFADLGIDCLVPFVKDGSLLGVLHLGPKRTLQPYSQLDRDFLNRLRTEVTVAYHNSLLFQNVTTLSTELSDLNKDLEQKVETRTHELKEAVDKLTELDRAKSEFFANVSHELRTPLTLILAPVEALLKGETGTVAPTQKLELQRIYDNALRLLKQINSLLDLGKLEAGRMKLAYRPGDLGTFFRGLVASVAPMAEAKRITLCGRETNALLPRVYFDRDRLEKVVLNLVFNAVKFTNPGGRVELAWGINDAGQLQVSVSDTGIGIAEKDLPKLFKRFSQVDSGSNRRYEGTGIGLALAKELVELHGGRIWVESQLGHGTTMAFAIPLRLEAEVMGEESVVTSVETEEDITHRLHTAAERHLVMDVPDSTPAGERPPQSNSTRILIVEDHRDMQEFIASQLEDDYYILKAHNGVEGVRMAMDELPDLIISDVMMPEKDGYQLCREIKTDERTKHIPVILLTARADLSLKIEGLGHGADEYLTKPFNTQELRAKIKSLFAQRQFEREIQQRNQALENALAELKATQAQLVQSEKLAGLGLLVAGMAHEINNPINFAKNSLETLQRVWSELKPLVEREQEAREAIEDLEASAKIVNAGLQRTTQIITQLKLFTRKDQNALIQCGVQEGLVATIELVRPNVNGNVTLHTDLQSAALVNMHPGKLNQVWMNLIQNAVQAVGESGNVWITSRDREHAVEVSIRDSGPGISEDHKSKLFQPFFTTKPVGQGTGLGLSVSYQIVQEVGGRIEVKSEAGRGAEFLVVLPQAQALAKAA